MKAIIPVAGAGTKLRPHTYTQPKALIPLAGKTILSIIVDQLMEAGITEFIFIVGYLGEKIQDFVKQKYPQLDSPFCLSERAPGHRPRRPADPEYCRRGRDLYRSRRYHLRV
ncbi:sugar phosphate nucleotidyltransferase [Puia sp. P3]|uniref:sugar phosphate nucleotidyltransferase n=1 Tax=Puia sp. P3 TaxID=3423952 RepID=UPI003D66813B